MKFQSCIRERSQIKNRLNLGHCPNRRAGGLTQNLDVPTLILISKISDQPKSAKNMKQTKISQLIRK